jgi:hypothetical protein
LIAWGQNCSSSTSISQPQDMPAETRLPAALWRRRRQIAAGESCFCWHVLGLRIARARRAILTPGYQLPLLRSSRIVVIDQNVRASRDVVQQENSGTDCIPKPDALQVLAYDCYVISRSEIRLKLTTSLAATNHLDTREHRRPLLGVKVNMQCFGNQNALE